MSKKILIIDDDQVNVQLVRSRLEQNGYDVVSALDGAVGLEMVKVEKPDLVILDVEMPRMNGYTFMTELRKRGGNDLPPVIVLTAHETMQPIFTLKGVRGYLVKPLKIDELLQKIAECLVP
jgi:CheY-like chemotaxis protein